MHDRLAALPPSSSRHIVLDQVLADGTKLDAPLSTTKCASSLSSFSVKIEGANVDLLAGEDATRFRRFIDDRLDSDALTGSVSTTDHRLDLPRDAWTAAGRDRLADAAFALQHEMQLAGYQSSAEEPLAVVRPLERIVAEGSGRVVSGMVRPSDQRGSG